MIKKTIYLKMITSWGDMDMFENDVNFFSENLEGGAKDIKITVIELNEEFIYFASITYEI